MNAMPINQADRSVRPVKPSHASNDSLARLHRLGTLTDHDLIIAWDIEIACRDLGGEPMRCWARHSAAAQRFKTWIDCLSAMRLPAGPVLDVVLQSRGLNEIDRRWRRRKGWARGIIRTALDQYPDVFAPAPAGGGRIAGFPRAAIFQAATLSHGGRWQEVA